MKRCAYCDSQVADNVYVCPHCNASEFTKVCDVCGASYEGSFCPNCAQRQAQYRQQQQAQYQAQQMRYQEQQAQQAHVNTVNSGLGWKTVLTFFLPCIGGYFLVRPGVKKGYTIFALVWSAIVLVAMLSGEYTTASSPGTYALSLLACAGPILYWAYLKYVKKAR